MTVTTGFAWLEVPASALANPISAGFTFSYTPNGFADNVTPPHPHNQAGTQQKGVTVNTLAGAWSVMSNNNISYLVAAGPQSEASGPWPVPSDKTAWASDQDVIIVCIKVNPNA
jgi:hypothetical protein